MSRDNSLFSLKFCKELPLVTQAYRSVKKDLMASL